MRKLISYDETPQYTGLEYDEMRHLKRHPELVAHYAKIVAERQRLGRDFQTKAPRKKKRRRSA